MLLKTELRFVNGIAVVDAAGRLVCTPGEESLRNRLLRLFDDGCPSILLNLERLETADSGGLGDLIAAYAAVTRRGGTLKLLRPPQRLRQTLRITHIESLFEIHNDENEATASFPAPSAPPRERNLTDFLND